MHPSTEQQTRSDDDKSGDRSQLDYRKPEFETAIRADAAEIDQKQCRGKHEDPHVGVHAGKPICHVGRGCDHLRADIERHSDPVTGASEKTGEGIEVKFAVNAKRSGGWMGARQFAQSHGDRKADESGGDEAENRSGSGNLHSGAGAEQNSSTDGAADSDHGHLSGSELMAESFFVGDCGRGGGHAAQYQKRRESIPKSMSVMAMFRQLS